MPIADHFKTGYEIKRITTTNVDGVITETEALVVTTSGRLRQLSSSEILANEKIGLITTHRFYCPVIDVKAADRINDTNNSKIYEVKGEPNNVMEYDEFLQANCEYREDMQ